MELEFLVSTVNRKSFHFLRKMFPSDFGKVKILCINQYIGITVEKNLITPKNVRCISVAEKGISKSRNLAIANSRADICVVSDDDLVYHSNSNEIIKNVYEKEDKLDVAVFQILTPEGKLYKKYKKNQLDINSPYKAMQVSSVEITFRRKSIMENNIRFNEKFGLGTKYPKGEETLFINECRKKGLKIKYYPIPIVTHPQESSGKTFSKGHILADGIIYTKLYSAFGVLFSMYFSIKRYRRYRIQFSFFNYLLLSLKGNVDGLFRKDL